MATMDGKIDPASCANFHQFRIVDFDVEWLVDFDNHVLSGSVDLQVYVVSAGGSTLYLDTRDLNIKAINVNGKPASFSFEEYDLPAFGKKLLIAMPTCSQGDYLSVLIRYDTSPHASALQWMPAEMTADKKQPYLFSQCQEIHARSIIPCMDTPSVKQKFTAKVTVPSQLTALMGALGKGFPMVSKDGLHRTFLFEQPLPIPSYLFALVVGALEKRDLSDRCALWVESSLLDRAVLKFVEVERILRLAEDMLGAYAWRRYDTVILPPWFPYHGMENSCLTCISASCLDGSFELASIIARETVYSWTGNLVTAASWQHRWLNEGFSTFLSRKICGSLYSESYRHFVSLSGWSNDLKAVVDEEFGKEHEFTKLVQDHTKIDPAKACSYLPGEKGSAFLFYLEQKLGGSEIFNKFVRSYVINFKFQSITTDDFLNYLMKYFHGQEEALEWIDFDHWLNDPGVPRMRPVYDHSLAKACSDMRELWLSVDAESIAMISSDDYHQLAPQQKIEFLSLLLTEKSIPHFKLETMSTLYGLRSASNCEVLVNFVRLGIKSRWPPAITLAIKLVSKQGRRKINVTVFRELAQWKPDIAKETFRATRRCLHPIVQQLIEDDLALIGRQFDDQLV